MPVKTDIAYKGWFCCLFNSDALQNEITFCWQNINCRHEDVKIAFNDVKTEYKLPDVNKTCPQIISY